MAVLFGIVFGNFVTTKTCLREPVRCGIKGGFYSGSKYNGKHKSSSNFQVKREDESKER